ncbi:MAG: SH3 domain-containing protein [Syntrophorhabdales bacterium]|nr:SH3 domain-containing protein [Syntrophorhabdales bacterium]
MLKIFVFTFSMSLIFAGTAISQSSHSDIGRYQLFQGTYKTYNIKTQQSDTSTGVFIIDTKTGEVKRYLNKIDEEGKYIETWVPTEMITPPYQKTKQVQSSVIYLIATKQSHIRSEADINSNSLRIVSPGTKMEKIDESGNMFKVRLPSGLIGWIHRSLTQQVPE